MNQKPDFTLTLEHTQGYEFQVHFDWDGVPALTLDEPEPLGHRAGPNASRLLAAAVANCLSASLLFCLTKDQAPPGAIRAEVRGHMGRNPRGRLRVQGLEVDLRLDEALAASPQLARCLDLYEDFCVVSASVRKGIPLRVRVRGPDGAILKESIDEGVPT